MCNRGSRFYVSNFEVDCRESFFFMCSYCLSVLFHVLQCTFLCFMTTFLVYASLFQRAFSLIYCSLRRDPFFGPPLPMVHFRSLHGQFILHTCFSFSVNDVSRNHRHMHSPHLSIAHLLPLTHSTPSLPHLPHLRTSTHPLTHSSTFPPNHVQVVHCTRVY